MCQVVSGSQNLFSSMIEHQFCKLKVYSSILHGENLFYLNFFPSKEKVIIGRIIEQWWLHEYFLEWQTHTHTQIHKVLQFHFTNFLILKSLHDSLIINVASYISLKILIK